jgi:hypothetical protein
MAMSMLLSNSARHFVRMISSVAAMEPSLPYCSPRAANASASPVKQKLAAWFNANVAGAIEGSDEENED